MTELSALGRGRGDGTFHRNSNSTYEEAIDRSWGGGGGGGTEG